MDFQICNMPQVLFPFAFIAGMWLWDTVLSKIFAEGTAPYFSGISVSSSAIPFVCRRLSASGIFVGCRILGIATKVRSSRQLSVPLSVPLLRLVIPAAVPIAIPGIVPPCHYPRSHFRSRPGAEPAGRRSVTAARCYRNVFCTGKVCPYGLIFAKAVPPAPLFRPGMAQKR